MTSIFEKTEIRSLDSLILCRKPCLLVARKSANGKITAAKYLIIRSIGNLLPNLAPLHRLVNSKIQDDNKNKKIQWVKTKNQPAQLNTIEIKDD